MKWFGAIMVSLSAVTAVLAGHQGLDPVTTQKKAAYDDWNNSDWSGSTAGGDAVVVRGSGRGVVGSGVGGVVVVERAFAPYPVDEGYVCPEGYMNMVNRLGVRACVDASGHYLDGYHSCVPEVSAVCWVIVERDPASLVTREDVEQLLVDHGSLSVWPSRGWAYINKPVYYESSAQAHDRRVTVAGYEVIVHLRPVWWVWDPGDGSGVLTTVSRGGPWPGGDVTHIYRAPGVGTQVRVTVSWEASFTVDGTTYPVAGSVTTTASTSLDLVEGEAVLTN